MPSIGSSGTSHKHEHEGRTPGPSKVHPHARELVKRGTRGGRVARIYRRRTEGAAPFGIPRKPSSACDYRKGS